MQKNINFNFKMNSTPTERIAFLESVGFDGVFLYTQYSPIDYIEEISKSKLKIETLHLPYKEIVNGTVVDSKFVNSLWFNNDRSNQFTKWLIDEVRFANNYGIKKVVAHITGGENPPDWNQYGLDNISKILEECEKYDIDFCIENTRRIDYIQYVLENLKSDKLKFCFDSGHANALTKNLENFPWQSFSNKLSCLHLHDNNGLKDEHLPPFSGNIDWQLLINKLFAYNPKLELTLEVRANDEQRATLTDFEYLQLCFQSASKLETIVDI